MKLLFRQRAFSWFDSYDIYYEDGSVAYYQAEGGCIPARYVRLTEEEAAAAYDADMAQFHADRGDSYGGGDAAGLDYDAYEKPKFENNVMPSTVKALYLNNEAIRNPEAYIAVADNCGINAFVVDVMDGGAIGYASPVMQQYSPSAYEDAYNTLENYQAAVRKLKDAGYYVIGRITAFNDPNLATDHPECVVADLDGNPLKIGGMYWPSVYSRDVWQYKVDLALEAARTMGFNEIQFDYVRFPDGTWDYDEAGTIDYRNDNDESKAQAVQRFLQYAADRLHGAGVYVSADVFGECAEKYVTAYGQYWAAISGVVDAISAMPYPDHYGASGDWLPWEHPHETMYAFGQKAAQRQLETTSPAAVRTWVQAYNAIREPYNIETILMEVLKLLEPEIQQRGIQINTDLQPSLPILSLDPVQIKQVFYNLIKNAYQSIPPEGGTILLKSGYTDDSVFVTVADTGCGISPEVMGSIYEPFLTTKSTGSGLGLLIVRRIVKEHGGSITLASQPGQGTTITVFLPRVERTIRLLPSSIPS